MRSFVEANPLDAAHTNHGPVVLNAPLSTRPHEVVQQCTALATFPQAIEGRWGWGDRVMG
jgi:hypothetical protein